MQLTAALNAAKAGSPRAGSRPQQQDGKTGVVVCTTATRQIALLHAHAPPPPRGVESLFCVIEALKNIRPYIPNPKCRLTF